MKKRLKDYFIPHEANGYKPHSLQKAAVLGMTFMVLLSFAVTNLQSLVWISSDWLVSTILPAVIVDMTNDERSDGALVSLRRSTVLDTAAKLKAQHMAKNEYFAHNSPDGVTPWYWFGQANYNFVHAGENLAIHFSDSGEVVEAWMDSPTHRANIMNGNYTEIGVGTAEGEYEGFKTVYVVQLFGTPAAAATVAGETSATPDAVAEPEPEPEPSPEAVEPEVVSEPEAVEPAEPAVVGEPEPEVVLAESVEVTETTEFIEAEPTLVEITETVSSETSPAANTEIANMEVTDTGITLYSDFISTSTGGVPADSDPTQTETINEPVQTWLGSILTQPHVVLQFLYGFTAALVLSALLLSIFIEIRRQEPIQVAYGVMLLLLMYGLFELHSYLSAGALIV